MLEPEPGSPLPDYQPGDYLQFDIPAYERDLVQRNRRQRAVRRGLEGAARLRLPRRERGCPSAAITRLPPTPAWTGNCDSTSASARPRAGQDCSAGAGSTYIHRLKPGDTVTAIGPFGDFHIKPTDREMVYIGGGAGMAPLRSHLSHLFETRKDRPPRQLLVWRPLAAGELSTGTTSKTWPGDSPISAFHLALSEPQPADNWRSYTGLIHEVLRETYLADHPDPPASNITCAARRPWSRPR